MEWKEMITADPKVMVGKPVIRGTRLTVEFIIELLANGWTEEQVMEHYEITHEQIRACLAYAHDILTDIRVYPLPDAASSR